MSEFGVSLDIVVEAADGFEAMEIAMALLKDVRPWGDDHRVRFHSASGGMVPLEEEGKDE